MTKPINLEQCPRMTGRCGGWQVIEKGMMMNGPNRARYGANYHSSIAMGLAFCFFAFAVGLTIAFRSAPVGVQQTRSEPESEELAMATGGSLPLAVNEVILESGSSTAALNGRGISTPPKESRKDPSEELPNEVRINKVPFETKLPDFGGEACVAMFLKAMGQDVDQDVVFDAAEVDPALGRGCYSQELAKACQKIGFKIGPVGFPCTDQNRGQLRDQTWQAIRTNLAKGIASVFCWNNEKGVENFILVLGVDHNRDIVIYHDPNKKNQQEGRYQTIDRDEFFKRCEISGADSNGRPTKSLIRLDLDHQNRPTVSLRVSKTKTDADFAQHIRKLKTRLPSDQFSIVIQKPFVVVGDEKPKQVKARSEGTVKWAVERLKQDYFQEDPFHIIDVWLFKDKASYLKHNELLWNDTPGTPYGFYSSVRRALVMNIATGGGTLVHEIVHPFMESNFEACPSWFNEGLASLYEQSNSRNGHIIGMTNWRLRGLQLAIRDGRVPPFKQLCGTTTREFYNDETGRNYAQARYLCYYLQEQGKLVDFYHSFVKNADKDPTGYETLKDILGRNDMPQFQREWQDYVMKLRF